MTAGRTLVALTVDDHPPIRAALREGLTDLASAVELLEACNPEEGLTVLRARPDTDLVCLDLSFAHHHGLAFIGRFRSAAPAARLVVYNLHEDVFTLRHALACGATGIIPKTHSSALVKKAVSLVVEGGFYLPAELARPLLAQESATAPPAYVGISSQQERILGLVAQGLPNKEIGRKLGIASSTVKNQLTVVFERLGVSNRTQAAISARAMLKGTAQLLQG